jgi:hypothetical protein
MFCEFLTTIRPKVMDLTKTVKDGAIYEKVEEELSLRGFQLDKKLMVSQI